jgi:NADPH:quinone reductase-like Zn-dependent oxidoreductase
MEQRMQAIGFRQYGGAEVLESLSVPKPALSPDTVLIRVIAASVNPSDALFRSGTLRKFLKLELPFVPGLDVAGVVTEVGSAVQRFRPGDAVYAMLPNTRMGGYAEFAAVTEFSVAHCPPNLTFAEAAAIPTAALTALQALRDQAHVKSDSEILINGASGGVGSFAVQIAKLLGAHVTATCSGCNIELVRRLGADIVIDYTKMDITAGEPRYNVVFDAVGVYPFRRWKSLLRPLGTLVTVNFIFGNLLQKLLARFDANRRQLKSLLVQPNGTDLELLNQWVVSGKLHPVIDKCYPLAEAAEAHRYSETKRVRGKLVLLIDEQHADKTPHDSPPY